MKYRLTEETLEVEGHILHRIVALRDFGDVKKGDQGGFIEKEINLSHDGNCWIYNNAKVLNNARVYDNALIYNEVIIHGSAHVYDNVRAFNGVNIGGNARVCGNVVLSDNVVIGNRANIYGNVWIYGSVYVCGNAEIFGEVKVDGNATITGDAKVCSIRDYLVFKNWWSSGRYFTWTRSNNMWKVGCFLGTGEELIRRAYADNSRSGREYARIVKYVEMIKQELK